MRFFAFTLSVLIAVPCAAQTLLFDFGRTDLQSGPGWNNVVPATTAIFPIIDDTGAVFDGARFEITDPFFQTGEPSQLGSESPGGDAAAYPVSATDDYFFGHTTGFAGADPNLLGQFSLSGLDANLVYDFTFFASRHDVSDTRDARYTVHGATSTSVVLDASNNDSEVAVVTGVAPDAGGEIVVDTEPGPANDNTTGFYYVGLVQVIARPRPSGETLFFGPSPYLSAADIPAGLYANGGPTALEDFEDCTLDFGIIATSGTPLSPPGGGCPQQSANVDSVDADDGAIDGSGSAGNSWFGAGTVEFTFPSPVTAAGLVFTDGAGPIFFSAYGPGGGLLGEIGPFTLDLPGAGNTADDHFFGIRDGDGIESIRLSLGGGVEVDHIQYGEAAGGPVPVPVTGTLGLMLLAVTLGAAGLAIGHERAS